MREYALHMGIDLGSTLSATEIDLFRARGAGRHFPRGSTLALQDEPATHLHLLQSGIVKTFQTHASGRETVLRIHLTGSIIGLSSLTSRGCWDATSVALKPSDAIVISTSAFSRLLEEHPQLSLRLVRLLVDRLSDLHFRIGELQEQSVEQRLAYVLLSLSRPDPEADCEAISLTHEELSQMINTRRQTVTSLLTKFSGEGLILVSHRMLKVVDREGLERRLGELAP